MKRMCKRKYIVEDKILNKEDRTEELFEKGLTAFNEKNYDRAIEMWAICARNDHINSIINLGKCHKNGWGVPRNNESAANFFSYAAILGDAGAQNTIGYYYTQGEGVPLDEKEAAYWFQKSAEQGHPTGMSNLGECYRDGYGDIEQDFAKAEYLFNKAIAAGEEGAKEELAKLKKIMTIP
ncbi:MAG: sel1 repeat family protein [Treponema sp.]|jgi:TPR repeat protein|nr:sel1 repeat family protein [Treponema sp.]